MVQWNGIFRLYLARYTQNFGIKFLKISVPFGVFGIFLVRSSQVLRAPRLWAKGWVREPLLLVLRPRRVKDIKRPSAFILPDDHSINRLLHYILHRADETQQARNCCPRLQFLAFSLDSIMLLSVKLST